MGPPKHYCLREVYVPSERAIVCLDCERRRRLAATQERGGNGED